MKHSLFIVDIIGSAECPRWPKQRGEFPMQMRKDWRQFVATVSQGKSQTLKPPHSDVSLHFPDGVYAVLQGSVHTDHSRFTNAIPKGECIVAPMVEFHECHSNEECKRRKHQFIIKIPHCVPDKSKWRYIRVRRGDIYLDEAFADILKGNKDGPHETYYKIDECFITIHTTHFTDYTCTLCNYLYCSNLAMIFLFGSLSTSGESTDVKVQPFLCSFLYVIEDFKQVHHYLHV